MNMFDGKIVESVEGDEPQSRQLTIHFTDGTHLVVQPSFDWSVGLYLRSFGGVFRTHIQETA